MGIYIIVTVLSVAIAAAVKKTYKPIGGIQTGTFSGISRQGAINILGLITIFLILFLCSALRYNVGNDYGRYEEFFHLIPLDQVVPTEAGFNATVLAIQFLFGGEAPLWIFGIYALATVMIMMAAVYRGSRNFLFSFFLFMTFSYYFQSLNTVRYYLAWAVALYCQRYVLHREYLKFVLAVLLTSTIHKSILIVIPAYLLASLSLKRIHYILMTGAALLAFVYRSRVLSLIIRFYPSYEGTSYLSGGTSVINIIRIFLVVAFALICLKRNRDEELEFYTRLNYFALLLYTCGSFVPEVSRVGYYLTGGHIFLLPGLAEQIRDVRLRRIAVLCIIIAALVYFAAFLYMARAPLVRIVPYHTWVF